MEERGNHSLDLVGAAKHNGIGPRLVMNEAACRDNADRALHGWLRDAYRRGCRDADQLGT